MLINEEKPAAESHEKADDGGLENLRMTHTPAETPNALKLSDSLGWRGGCAGAGAG